MKLSRWLVSLWMLLLIPISVFLTSYADGSLNTRRGSSEQPGRSVDTYRDAFHHPSDLGGRNLAGSKRIPFIPGNGAPSDITIADSGMTDSGTLPGTMYEDAGPLDKALIWIPSTESQEERGRSYLHPVIRRLLRYTGKGDAQRLADDVDSQKPVIAQGSLVPAMSDPASRLQWIQAGDTLRIRLPDPFTQAKVLIRDLRGRDLSAQTVRGLKAEIEVTSWPRQMYLVKVEQGLNKFGGKIQLR